MKHTGNSYLTKAIVHCANGFLTEYGLRLGNTCSVKVKCNCCGIHTHSYCLKKKFHQEPTNKVKLEGGSRSNILFKMNVFGIAIHCTDI